MKEGLALGDGSASESGSRVVLASEPEAFEEHGVEGSDDGVALDLEGGDAAIGQLVEHLGEEGDEGFGEAGEVDVREVVGAKLVPRGTVVGEYDVDGGFEDDETETVRERGAS